ncbi:MAG: sialidase [Rhodocyclales bacterium]|nr:sialidase [Rhodocyclales bacterium]
MNRAIGILFTVFVAAVVVFSFSPRHGPALPATTIAIAQTLALDVQRVGSRLVSVGERGRIFVSDDDGAHWKGVASPTEATLTALAFVDEKRGVAVGHDAVIVATADGGLNWHQVHSAPDERTPLLDVWFDRSGRGIAVGAYGTFLESLDGGASWGASEAVVSDWHFNAVAGLADGTRLIAGESGTLLRSVDGGDNWVELTSPYKGSYFGLLALGDGGVVVFGMRGHVYRSDDRGDTWQAVAHDSQASLFGGRVLDDGSLALVGQNGTLLVSRDGGRSFKSVATNINQVLSAVIGVRNGAGALLFGEGGVAQTALAQGGVQ